MIESMVATRKALGRVVGGWSYYVGEVKQSRKASQTDDDTTRTTSWQTQVR